MTDFSIRPAMPADIPAIYGLITELADFEKLRHLVVATEQSLHDALFGAHPACECVVASEGGKTVAFALFFHNFSTFLGRKGLYLEDLYVKQECRANGYGTLLLKYLAKLAVERGCGRFEWSVLDWNEKAIGFYKKMGADVMPDWRICRLTGDGLARLAS